jgi:hypothetical protein
MWKTEDSMVKEKESEKTEYPNGSWERIKEFDVISHIKRRLCSPSQLLRHFWSTQQPWRSVASSTQLAVAASIRNCIKKRLLLFYLMPKNYFRLQNWKYYKIITAEIPSDASIYRSWSNDGR